MSSVALVGGLVYRGRQGFETADVLVEDGRIAAVGEVHPPVGAEIVNAERRLVLPGLVNSHTHSNDAWMRGRFERLPLDLWLLHASPRAFAPAQSEREIYLRTALGAMEMAHTGATCVVDFLYELAGMTERSLAAVIRAYRDVGVRALICLAVSDRSFVETAALDLGLVAEDALVELSRSEPPAASEWLTLARSLVARFHRPEQGVSIGLAPAGPHRCSEELLLGCRSLADELDLQIHTHTLEIRRHAGDGGVIHRLAEIGFLSPRSHLVHGVWLDEHDPERIANSGATVVHNPHSNLKLGSGVAPIPALRRAGVDVALGSDGVSCGDGQNVLAAMRLAALLHTSPDVPYEQWLGARDALEMATVAGARAAGDPEGLGRIARGARADLVLLDLDHAAFTPLGDPLVHVAFGAPAGALHDVLAGGRWIVRDGSLTGVDESALLAEAREAAIDVVARHEHAWRISDALSPAVAAGWRRELETAGARSPGRGRQHASAQTS